MSGGHHGGMQRSLEMMKKLVKGGSAYQDRVEELLPLVVLGLVVVAVLVFAISRLAAWLL